MKAPTRFGVLVVGTFIAAATILVPSRKEWLSVLLDEGKDARIISLLAPRLGDDPDDPSLLATLASAYAGTHVYDRAIALMNRYIAIRPEDGDAYGRLADLYKKSGDTPNQIMMLERAVALRPELPRVSELAALYLGAHRPHDELALLSRFERKLTVASGLLLRLAQLLEGSGDLDRAIATLARPDILAGSPQGPQQAEARLFLAQLLVKANRGADIVTLGKKWIVQWHEPWLAGRLLRSVAVEAPASAANEIADAVVASDPAIRLYLVHALAQMGAKPVARHLLETWVLNARSPSTNEIAGFLAACWEQNEPAIAWQAFATIAGDDRSSAATGRFAEAMAATFGIGALAPFWSSLPPSVRERAPLLEAQLAYNEGNQEATIWLLEKTSLALLSASGRRIWMDLLIAAAPPDEAFEIMRGRRLQDALPTDMLPTYARLAGERGDENEFRAARAKLQTGSR